MGEDNSNAVVMAVYAALVYDIIAAVNSSPQTTEINAAARAETLMKWVHLGLAQAGVFVVLGAYMSKGSKWPALVGGGLAGVLLYVQYVHAKEAGLKSSAPPTETYGPSPTSTPTPY